MTRAVLRYLALLPANAVFVLLAYALSPLLALLSMATGPVLPGFLQWFSTTDDTLDGGQHQHPETTRRRPALSFGGSGLAG